MPRALKYTTEQARDLFKKYGYMPRNDFEFVGINKTYRVLNEVLNTFQDVNFNTFMRKIKKNQISEVDPFLNTLYHNPNPQPTHISDRLSRYTAIFPFDQFKKESVEIRLLTMRKAQDFKQKALPHRHQNVKIERTDDEIQDKSSLYALIDTIYAISTQIYKEYRIVLEIGYQPFQDPEIVIPQYYTLNEETVSKLKALINEIWFGEKKVEYDDSDKFMLPALSDWTKITILFERLGNRERLNRLDEPGTRRAGAKWAWINNTTIDLTKYGIFNSFDLNNYRYPCFIWALEQSKQLSDSEVEFIKQIVNTKYFPMDNLKKICKKLNICVEVRTLDAKNKTHITRFGDSNKRIIKLLLRDNHYMLDEDVPLSTYYIENYKFVDENINPNSKVYDKKTLVSRLYPDGNVKDTSKKGLNINKVIDLFFKNNYFDPLSEQELYQTLFVDKNVNYVDLTYPDCCAEPVYRPEITETKKNVVFVDDFKPIIQANRDAYITKSKVETDDTIYRKSNQWFNFNDVSSEEIDKIRNIFREKFEIDFVSFSTPASIGHELMHKYNCFDNVFELCGKPAEFISKCSAKVVCAPAFGKKQEESGDFVCLDKIGSYSSIYTRFEGIPCGKPKIMKTMDDLQNYSDYYLYLNITAINCKHSEDRFPTITKPGPVFVSRLSFENLLKHYDIEYNFISGYYFDEGFNENIKRLATDLYNIRNDLKRNNERIQCVFKLILNTLWGRCTYKPKLLLKKVKSADRLDYLLNKHSKFMYSYRKCNNSTVQITLANPLALDYGIPHFSSNILSYSRAFMNDIYFKASDMNMPIYYSRTDSLLINRDHAYKLNIIGNELGDFQIEYDNIAYFKIFSANRFVWEYSDEKESRRVNMK